MLPHYSPLKVAETFSILSALFPDRVDLGIGRAPGTDHSTAFALQRDRRQSTSARSRSTTSKEWLIDGMTSYSTAVGNLAIYRDPHRQLQHGRDTAGLRNGGRGNLPIPHRPPDLFDQRHLPPGC
jgi:alkanesulfonate monooxygenase SsuD/methylene tetrahydromethanopterin reductase-like flavin-dependent oxidoreductase (luciferase family)